MRFVCISDTHTYHREIDLPEGDVLIHSGDATIGGTLKESMEFAEWWNELPYLYKIFVPGNHDSLWMRDERARQLIIPLINETKVIEDIRIFGFPFVKRYGDWAFMLGRELMHAMVQDIPEDIDILISHGPPWGILDDVGLRGRHLGCEELLVRVRDIKPAYHIFGHIHEGYGIKENHRGTTFINASILDGVYDLKNKPIVFDYEKTDQLEKEESPRLRN